MQLHSVDFGASTDRAATASGSVFSWRARDYVLPICRWSRLTCASPHHTSCSGLVLVTATTKRTMFPSLYLLTMVIVVSHTYPHHQRNDHCYQVRQVYLHHHKHGSQHNSSPLCTHSSTGCCHGLDGAIEQQSRNELSTQLTIISQINSLKTQYTQLDSRIQKKLFSIFNQSDASTMREPREEQIVRISNERLLNLVHSFIATDPNQSENGQIEERVDQLIEAIFINELQKTHRKKYPQDYVDCLKNILREESSLLSNTRQLMVHRLYRAIETSRLILQSLELSSTLLERANNIHADERCVQQWAEAFHCGRCNGQMGDETRPCASLCRHTLATCFQSTHWTLLHTLFHTMDASYNQLINLVINSFNPETIIARQHMELMKEAREVVVLNSERLAKNARVSCGPPKRYFRSISMDNTYDYYNYTKTSEEDLPTTNNLSLYVLLQSLGHLFNKNKDIFAKFPDKMCHKYSDNHCWDGNAVVSTYQKLKPMNNETEASNIDDQLSQQMHELRNLIDRYSNLRLTQGNNSALLAEDDEDYTGLVDDERDGFSDMEDGSGSGEGSGSIIPFSTDKPDISKTTQPDVIFETTAASNENDKSNENSGSFAVRITLSNYLVSLVLFLYIFAGKHFSSITTVT